MILGLVGNQSFPSESNHSDSPPRPPPPRGPPWDPWGALGVSLGSPHRVPPPRGIPWGTWGITRDIPGDTLGVPCGSRGTMIKVDLGRNEYESIY